MIKINKDFNYKYVSIFFVFAIIISFVLFYSIKQSYSFINLLETENSIEVRSKLDKFRNSSIRFIRDIAENYPNEEIVDCPSELNIEGNWDVKINIYHEGEMKAEHRNKVSNLCSSLSQATKEVVKDFNLENAKESRFLVSIFPLKGEPFSFAEYKGQGKEIINNLIPVRSLDKKLIEEKIKQGKEFLYKMENQDKHGFYKKYDALNDILEERLHTVYSASIIYTFLYLYDLEKDPRILEETQNWAEFLMSMQNKDEESKRYGAFSYSFYLNTQEKEKKYVVGTSALSIFTLLRLYESTNDSKYLESAKLAGNWLLTMQREDGVMKPYTRYSNEKWLYGTKESLLYNGQVLSSLSKLYSVTKEDQYYQAAERIAKHFAEKHEKVNGYVRGEYRIENPISNSWIVMSLMDFYKISKQERYKDIIFELSEEILIHQKNDEDILSSGAWYGAFSTSGIGWISEVMSDTYNFCKKERGEDCEKYKEAVVKGIRWIIQNTYSMQNSFIVKNPEKSFGGIFWNEDNKYIRTDSVCHGLNAYTIIIKDLEDVLLLSFPEKELNEILNNLKQ